MSPYIVRGGPGGPAEPRIRWGFAGGCLLASIFTRSKRFFRFSLRGPVFMVPDNMVESEMYEYKYVLYNFFESYWKYT